MKMERLMLRFAYRTAYFDLLGRIRNPCILGIDALSIAFSLLYSVRAETMRLKKQKPTYSLFPNAFDDEVDLESIKK
jgi:hypothetical protein